MIAPASGCCRRMYSRGVDRHLREEKLSFQPPNAITHLDYSDAGKLKYSFEMAWKESRATAERDRTKTSLYTDTVMMELFDLLKNRLAPIVKTERQKHNVKNSCKALQSFQFHLALRTLPNFIERMSEGRFSPPNHFAWRDVEEAEPPIASFCGSPTDLLQRCGI